MITKALASYNKKVEHERMELPTEPIPVLDILVRLPDTSEKDVNHVSDTELYRAMTRPGVPLRESEQSAQPIAITPQPVTPRKVSVALTAEASTVEHDTSTQNKSVTATCKEQTAHNGRISLGTVRRFTRHLCRH